MHTEKSPSPKHLSLRRFFHGSRGLCVALAILFLGIACWPAMAIEQVTYRRNGKTGEVTGRLILKAADGGLLLLARDGVIWAIQPDEIVKHSSNAAEFSSYSRDEMAKRLLAELPQGFRTYSTEHYLIFYDTSLVYARWCGALFERLYAAFTNYWTRTGFDLSKPEFPLVAVLFSNRDAYLSYSRAELGDGNASISGYYSLLSNRMTMYDLTGVEASGLVRSRGRTAAQINQILMQPDATQTVATVVHEATHQIAFNCGLHTRLSDCPLWFCEGIAMYCETPDLRSAKGWHGIGAVNGSRLDQFQHYLASRPSDSLKTLLGDDARFRDSRQALDAYAEAWSLTYFLLHRHPKEYVRYLAMLSKKTALSQDTPEARLKQFTEIFGNLKTLDDEFLRYMNRLR
jgi:hypothetical protein